LETWDECRSMWTPFEENLKWCDPPDPSYHITVPEGRPQLQICNPSLALALLFPLIFRSTVVRFLYLHFHEAPPACAVAWDSWLFETFRAYSTAAFAASPNSLSVCSPRPDSLIYKGENVSTLKPPDITGSPGAY
jgi:hypothetical protein